MCSMSHNFHKCYKSAILLDKVLNIAPSLLIYLTLHVGFFSSFLSFLARIKPASATPHIITQKPVREVFNYQA